MLRWKPGNDTCDGVSDTMSSTRHHLAVLITDHKTRLTKMVDNRPSTRFCQELSWHPDGTLDASHTSSSRQSDQLIFDQFYPTVRDTPHITWTKTRLAEQHSRAKAATPSNITWQPHTVIQCRCIYAPCENSAHYPHTAFPLTSGKTSIVLTRTLSHNLCALSTLRLSYCVIFLPTPTNC